MGAELMSGKVSGTLSLGVTEEIYYLHVHCVLEINEYNEKMSLTLYMSSLGYLEF